MQPTILIESLEAVRRRVRLLAVAYGLGLVVTVAVCGLLAAVFADYLLNLPAGPRAALVLAAAATVAFGVWRWLVQPLLARLTLNDVAGRVERTYPQFQDRLRSTVDILLGRDVPGSEVMKQRVVSEAARLTQSLDLSRVVVARPVWYSSAGALAAVAAVGLIAAAVGPDLSRLALARLFTPFRADPWPKTVVIESAGTVPDRVTVGQRVDVDVRLARGDRASRRATIFYQYGDPAGHFGPVQQEYMTRGDDGVYHAAVDARVPDAAAGAALATTGRIKIWTESGDGHLDVPPVRVVQRLSIDRVEAFVTPPPYAGQPPVHVDLNQPVTVTVGSAVRLVAEFNKPLDPARPVTTELLTGGMDALRWMPASTSSVQATFTAAATARFHLHAADADGVTNAGAEEFELVVRPDQMPTVMIENPRRNEDRTPTAAVPLQAVAEDDFGVASVTLVVDRLGDKRRWEVPLVHDAAGAAGVQWVRADANATAGGGEVVRFRANYTWDLAAALGRDANLKAGDTLDYFLLARDNYALDGATHPPVSSGHLRLNLISQDELDKQVTDLLQTVAEQTAVLKRSQADTQRQTAALAKATADKPALDAADAVAADRLSGQQGTLASQVKSVADKLAEVRRRLDENRSPNADLKATAKDVGDLLTSAAEGTMKNAAASVANAKAAPAPDARRQEFKDANTAQVQSGEQLQKALDRMGNIGSLSRTIDNVRTLLADQQKLSAATAAAGKATLGQTADQVKPEDRAKLDDLAKQQDALADRTARAMDEMAKDADKLAKSDPSSSQAMKQAADTGQQQAVVPSQSKAAKSTSQNKQTDAQSAQKKAEMGLQMMLADLREAERHKLDELNRKLAEVQQQVGVLIRRQSGHNLDTLSNMGPASPAVLDDKARAVLTEQAERDPKALPPVPDLPTLSAAQEQTERNARDVAKAAEDLPDGSAPADHLTDAADQMERAIVHLRAEQLPAAYSPPQVNALDALLAAKRIIDEQKRKSDAQRENQKKEVIRQAYIAIRADQFGLNTKTANIDTAPKNDDGSRRREDAIALAQLPGEQGGLADRTAKLDGPLSAVGSVVYTWANNEIVKNMRAVTETLGRQETGPVAQVGGKQVLDELDAVIRDLAVKPEVSKFDQHAGGGGGGGGGSPSMPTEAELRLMKDLQVAENDATTALDKAAAHQKADTLALGGRQGDLRGLLDTLIQKASGGKAKLPPEPDNADQLPEEKAGPAAAPGAAQEKVDDQELQDDLIGAGAKPAPKPPAGGPPGVQPAPAKRTVAGEGDHELALVGDRMARSRQRLATNDDPGTVTQEIQRRILDNLDDLIEQARKKESQQQNQDPKPGDKGEKMADAKPDPGAQQQGKAGKGQHADGGTAPAQTANAGGGGASPPAGGDVARQDAKMWGQPSPRERNAIVESNGERVLEKYKPLVDDYYRNMSTRAKAAGQ